MIGSNIEGRFQTEIVNFAETRLVKVKVMVCQLDFDEMDYDRGTRLCFVKNSSRNQEYLRRFLNIASKLQVDLLVFPELTIPSEFVNELVGVSSRNDMYIIGGTHYKKRNEGFLSICPIVTPRGVYETEKISPAPFEKSSFQNEKDGAISGHVVRVFHGTKIGDFAVTICLDYTDDELRTKLGKDQLDFLIVPAFNQQSDEFFYSMHSDVQRSSDGLYVIYSNTYSKVLNGEGRSSLFAFVEDCYRSEFKDKGRSDMIPPNKIYEYSEDKNYCIFELDITHKKPYKSKNGYSESNVKVIEEDNNQMSDRYGFLKAIGVDEDRYKFIDSYYVKPKEYKEMSKLLEKDNVLVITGDPGIGKTYTAVHFLQKYYRRGYRPLWFYGLAKEDRDSQKEQLLTFEPQDRDAVYIEDPFGKTVFENREELKTIFSNLIQRFRSSKAKLIITSRTEVFKQFKNEVVSADNLEAFKKELNVRNPSYDIPELQLIARHYIKSYTSWGHKKNFISIVMNGISQKKLISPLMIYNLVKNHSDAKKTNILMDAINSAQTTDLICQFAYEIKSLSHPAKVLLYMVLLYGKQSVSLNSEMFDRCQAALRNKILFEGSSFIFELRGQDNHRIQRLGLKYPAYRFSHPAYEEALITLTESDSTCALIAEICLKTILKQNSHVSVELFRRFIFKNPHFVEQIVNLSLQDILLLSEFDKLTLSHKMLLSKNDVFRKTAIEVYPIKNLIDNLYLGDVDKYFILRLRLLNLRKKEIGTLEIDFKRVFSEVRLLSRQTDLLLTSLELATSINQNMMKIIECNFHRNNLIMTYSLLPNEIMRERLNELLSNTIYHNVYMEIKDTMPEILTGKGSRMKLILNHDTPKGYVYLDDGAMKAVMRQAKIYPIGVIDVIGNFEYGDVVYLADINGKTRVRTFVEMSSDDIKKFKRLHSSEIYELVERIIPTGISRPSRREKV